MNQDNQLTHELPIDENPENVMGSDTLEAARGWVTIQLMMLWPEAKLHFFNSVAHSIAYVAVNPDNVAKEGDLDTALLSSASGWITECWDDVAEDPGVLDTPETHQKLAALCKQVIQQLVLLECVVNTREFQINLLTDPYSEQVDRLRAQGRALAQKKRLTYSYKERRGLDHEMSALWIQIKALEAASDAMSEKQREVVLERAYLKAA